MMLKNKFWCFENVCLDIKSINIKELWMVVWGIAFTVWSGFQVSASSLPHYLLPFPTFCLIAKSSSYIFFQLFIFSLHSSRVVTNFPQFQYFFQKKKNQEFSKLFLIWWIINTESEKWLSCQFRIQKLNCQSRTQKIFDSQSLTFILNEIKMSSNKSKINLLLIFS